MYTVGKNLEKIHISSMSSSEGVNYFDHVILNSSVSISSFNVNKSNVLDPLLSGDRFSCVAIH